MREEPKEYSLTELINHPGLGLVMTGDGIERRCLELLLDMRGHARRETDGARDKSTGWNV